MCLSTATLPRTLFTQRTRSCKIERFARRQSPWKERVYPYRPRNGKSQFYRCGQKKGRGHLRAASDAYKSADESGRKPRTCRRKRLPHGTRRLRRDDGSVPELYQRVRKKGTPCAFLFLCRQIFRKNLINRGKYIWLAKQKWLYYLLVRKRELEMRIFI